MFFYFLSLLGIFAVLLLSLSLDHLDFSFNRILSTGGLLILGFQYDLIHPLRKAIAMLSDGQDWMHSIATLLASVTIMAAFIPLTYIASKWLPFLIGFRKTNIK